MTKRDYTPPKSINNRDELKALKPAATRYEVADTSAPGLRIRVLTSVRKLFIWRVRFEGKQHIINVGEYPEMSLAKVHGKFDALKDQHEDGALIDKTKPPKTVRELIAEFDKYVISTRHRPDAARQIFNHDLIPELGARKLATVRPVDVSRMVKKLIDRDAKAHAKKLLALTKQLFNYGVAHGYLDTSLAEAPNAKNLGIGSLPARRRNLDNEDIVAF